MEFPAHLTERLLQGESIASFVGILQFHLITLLVCVVLFQLLTQSLVVVATDDNIVTL